jgi:hypothetical protein
MADSCQEFRFTLDQPRGAEHGLAPIRIGPSLLEVGDQEARAFYLEELMVMEPSLSYLLSQFSRKVEVGGGEEPGLRSWMHAGSDSSLDNPIHLLFVESIEPYKEIEERGETGDRGCEQQAARAQDPSRLSKRRQTVAPFDEVVERAKEQHNVDGAIPLAQLSGVAELGGHLRVARLRLLDVELDGFDDMDPVARSASQAA